MLFQINNEEILPASKMLTTSQLKVKQLPLQKNLGTQVFQYDASDLFQRMAKAVEGTSEKLPKQSKAITEAIEDLNEKFPTNAPAEEPPAITNPDPNFN